MAAVGKEPASDGVESAFEQRPMWEHLRALAAFCHASEHEQIALRRACDHLRGAVGARCLALFRVTTSAPTSRLSLLVGAGSAADATLRPAASASVETGELSSDASVAAVPVWYATDIVGAVAWAWNEPSSEADHATPLLAASSVVFAPLMRALLDRDGPNESLASHRISGPSDVMSRLRERVALAARAPFAVLIEGESGTGKELVARALHEDGPRRHMRFCAVNCAALTDDLFEAELFGHVRGAFTGAVQPRVGLFEAAHGGTLFLDEIGELSLRGQAKLLRVIEDGEVRRVGENTSRRVDVRIVAATNRHLEEEVRRAAFRSDLIYRLAVIRIRVPPLGERLDDIPTLARIFWHEATTTLGSYATLAPETVRALVRRPWPGNVRELQNVLFALAARSPRRGRVQPGALEHADGVQEGPRPSLVDARRTYDRQVIGEALAESNGSIVRAARELGITRHGLRKLIRRLGLESRLTSSRDAQAGIDA